MIIWSKGKYAIGTLSNLLSLFYDAKFYLVQTMYDSCERRSNLRRLEDLIVLDIFHKVKTCLKDKSHESQLCGFTDNVVYRQKPNRPYNPKIRQAWEG
jgi:hypothetical protein